MRFLIDIPAVDGLREIRDLELRAVDEAEARTILAIALNSDKAAAGAIVREIAEPAPALLREQAQ